MIDLEIEEVLELDIRKNIYNHILENPGLHLRELSRRLNIPKTTLKYHIRLLIKRKLITIEENGKYIRYFAKNQLGIIDKKFLIIIRQEKLRRIIFLSYLYKKLNIYHISKSLDLPITTVSYQIQKLKNAGIFDFYKENGKINYFLKDRNYIYNLFLKYQKTLSEYPFFQVFFDFIKKALPDGKLPIKSANESENSINEIIEELTKLFSFNH